MTPQEKAALIAFAGPLFQEAKQIDSMVTNDAKSNNMPIGRSAQDIQHALERDFQEHAAPVLPVGYSVPVGPITVPEHLLPLQFVSQIVPQSQPDQLEFSFNRGAQEITNDLLESVLKKLNVIIKLLESNQTKELDVPKLKVQKIDTPKVSEQH